MTTRCSLCRKKLGLLEYKCKCGNIYCITHLHAENHKCSFDYQAEAKQQLKKQIDIGPLAEKLVKI